VPVSGTGYSGEAAVAVPIVLQVPDAGLAHNSPPESTASALGVSTDAGNASDTD
jgi:hypothetical protein